MIRSSNAENYFHGSEFTKMYQQLFVGCFDVESEKD